MIDTSSIVSDFFLGVEDNYPTLLIFTFSIAIYSILIYIFYRFIAKRDVFGFDIEKYKHEQEENFISKIFNFILSLFKYGFVFPVIVFLWFAAFSTMLFVFSKELPIDELLVLSITIVSAIRVTSYFTEDLSRDLAKLLPLALLATFLTDPNFFSMQLFDERLETIELFIPNIVQFVSFSIVLEWILRVLFFLRVQFFGLPEGMVKKKNLEDLD